MKTIFETKEELKEFMKLAEVKGRTKINSLEELLKALKTQNPEIRKDLMKAQRMFTKNIDKHNNILSKLAAPEAPLKGRGYERVEIHVPNELKIPDNHCTTVLYRRQKGYFGSSEAVSPEVDKVISAYFVGYHQARAIAYKSLDEKLDAEREAKRLEIEKAKKQQEIERAKRMEEISKKYGSDIKTLALMQFKEACKKTESPFWANQSTFGVEFPDVVEQLKDASGLSWREFARTI
jgi:hypothetical protein